jgi:hypothetical protein
MKSGCLGFAPFHGSPRPGASLSTYGSASAGPDQCYATEKDAVFSEASDALSRANCPLGMTLSPIRGSTVVAAAKLHPSKEGM